MPSLSTFTINFCSGNILAENQKWSWAQATPANLAVSDKGRSNKLKLVGDTCRQKL